MPLVRRPELRCDSGELCGRRPRSCRIERIPVRLLLSSSGAGLAGRLGRLSRASSARRRALSRAQRFTLPARSPLSRIAALFAPSGPAPFAPRSGRSQRATRLTLNGLFVVLRSRGDCVADQPSLAAPRRRLFVCGLAQQPYVLADGGSRSHCSSSPSSPRCCATAPCYGAAPWPPLLRRWPAGNSYYLFRSRIDPRMTGDPRNASA